MSAYLRDKEVKRLLLLPQVLTFMPPGDVVEGFQEKEMEIRKQARRLGNSRVRNRVRTPTSLQLFRGKQHLSHEDDKAWSA